MSTVDISHVSSEMISQSVIHIKTPSLEQLRYHAGYRIQTERTKADGQVKIEIFELNTGMDLLEIPVDIYKSYTVTVWPITHEGYGKSDSETFLSRGISK